MFVFEIKIWGLIVADVTRSVVLLWAPKLALVMFVLFVCNLDDMVSYSYGRKLPKIYGRYIDDTVGIT